MEITLLKLLLAHILGDFFFQPDAWVKEKEQKKLKSPKLYAHVAIHVLLIFVVFFSFKIWLAAIVIGVLHFIIDAIKLIYQRPKTKQIWFFIDQLLHVSVIVIYVASTTNFHIDVAILQQPKILVFVFSALLLTAPAAVFIRVIIAKFIPNQANDKNSLQNAGKFIGMLERLLIFLFVCTNHFEAVGFLLAAKSIFRFGDLKEAHDIKLTEYVLIGTLLSFGIALVVSLLTLNFNSF